jgi:hypothetical protein
MAPVHAFLRESAFGVAIAVRVTIYPQISPILSWSIQHASAGLATGA